MKKKSKLIGVTSALALALPAGASIAQDFAQAQATKPTFTVLHSFAGGSDGVSAYAGLVADKHGALYGTTNAGGLGYGTVFKLTPPTPPATRWTKTTIYSFKGGNNASTPSYGALVFDTNGSLYGTAGGGGTVGQGTVYKLTPPVAPATHWTETLLYSFKSGNDAGQPLGGLVMDTNGALYGATGIGGGSGCNCGAVFKLTPPVAPATPWTETLLYSFKDGSDGAGPYAVSLIFDTNGALYGTTSGGGAFKSGTVFKLTPPVPPATQWTETILYSFQGGPADGAYPLAGLTFDSEGALYGTTQSGGTVGVGVVFKLAPPAPPSTQWTETVLHSFAGVHDGASPVAGVVFGPQGALYGTTELGGSADWGTVYKLTPPVPPATQWSETILHNFTRGRDGGEPFAGSPTFDASGALYGTTLSGGAANFGTVYEIR